MVKKNKVPATVTWVEMLDTQDAKVILMFRSGKTEHKQLLSESLHDYLTKAFGGANVLKDK